MMLEILFWLLFVLIAIPYILFPAFLRWKAKGRKLVAPKVIYKDQLISIVMAVHNEEEVLEEKLVSIFSSTFFPFEVLVGSDASTDGTHSILEKWSKSHSNLRVYYYTERQGKINIINDLVRKAQGDVIVSTDAKAIFLPDTLAHLVARFSDSQVGMVGAFLINPRQENAGIVRQEDFYMNGEMELKYVEGLLYGKVMGVYGALYAIRKELFPVVPAYLMVDDLYITLKVIERGFTVVMEPNAKAILKLPLALDEEFRRKVRIAIGDFQNLKIFSTWLLHPRRIETWLFFCHKILRWLTPFFLLGIALIFPFLQYAWLYKILLLLFIFFFTVPLLDFLLSKVGVYVYFLRLITHFLAMNLALLVGFLKSFRKRTKAIWDPSKR
jgi:cellulose synthase/poly-beta-1,6-N-acetylglucosamine synthase-like glycosyltransferase